MGLQKTSSHLRPDRARQAVRGDKAKDLLSPVTAETGEELQRQLKWRERLKGKRNHV